MISLSIECIRISCHLTILIDSNLSPVLYFVLILPWVDHMLGFWLVLYTLSIYSQRNVQMLQRWKNRSDRWVKCNTQQDCLSNINLHAISITTIAETTTDDLTKGMRVYYEKERPNAGGHLEWGLRWRICVSGEMINRLSVRQEVNQEREEPVIQITESQEKSMLWQTMQKLVLRSS